MVETEATEYATPPQIPGVSRPKRKSAPRKPKGSAKPLTRAQGAAYGALGLTLGNAITLAVAKWLGAF